MLILGITGGVGSGKSRILSELKENHGAYIVEADAVAHRLMEPGQEAYGKIVEAFGNDILKQTSPYEIDRSRFAEIVFQDKEKLEQLNQIVHPAVKNWIRDDIAQRKREQVALYVIEAALLIQDGYREICDEIWYIYVPKEERTRRLMKQRSYTRERCEAMYQSQEGEAYYRKYADFTINNQNSFEDSSKQLNDRLNKLRLDGIIF